MEGQRSPRPSPSGRLLLLWMLLQRRERAAYVPAAAKQKRGYAEYRAERVRSVFKETSATYITAKLEKQRTETDDNHMLPVTIL